MATHTLLFDPRYVVMVEMLNSDKYSPDWRKRDWRKEDLRTAPESLRRAKRWIEDRGYARGGVLTREGIAFLMLVKSRRPRSTW